MDEKDYNIANNVVMKAKDSLQANLGKCTITNGTKRYNFMQAINLEANFEKTKEEIKVAIAEADKAPKQKVSDFLKNMFEVQPQTIKEQIAFYEAKESK